VSYLLAIASSRRYTLGVPYRLQQHCSVSADRGESTGMFAESVEQSFWFAIQTRSRHEKVVRDQLAAKSITHLLPLWRKRSIWKDRVKFVDVPLFSGYLFGYFALQDKITVLETVGVARLVGINGKPMPIPEEQIVAVRTMMEHRLPCSPHPYLVEGMRVRIKCGLLAGAEGILIAKKQRHRLVISLDIIHQAVAVDVDSAAIEPLDARPQGIAQLPLSSSPCAPCRTAP
jgi:transcription termination/antitermination protein NusG